MGSRPDPAAEDRLDSWKEIASYLKRDVRTVQRWEKKEGLPVHRHLHDKLGSVYAFKAEVDAWWRDRRPALDAAETQAEAPAEAAAERAPAESAAAVQESRPWTWAAVAVAVAVLAMAAYLAWPPGEGRDPAPGRVVLAVLPFENRGGDPQQEYFADGMTDEMIAQLGRLHPERLGVISRVSAMHYKNSGKRVDEIGRELGADYILEGSVRREGGRVRITAELVHVGDQAHVWANSYERDLRNILDLQGEVARAIATAVAVELTSTEEARLRGGPLASPEAYESYLLGRYFWSKRNEASMRKSVEQFEEAIRQDPQYAPAYAGLADAYMSLGSTEVGAMPPREAMPRAQRAAERALALDESIAEAHASLAMVALEYERDLRKAEREFQRAIELNPAYATAHQWYALYLIATGRSEEALAEVRRAQQLDPLATAIRTTLAQVHYYARQFDRAIEVSRRTLEMEPNSVVARLDLCRAYLGKNMHAEAIAECERGVQLSGGHPALLMLLGHVYGVAGREADARRLLRQLQELSRTRYVPPLYLAAVHTGLGEYDQAFAALEKAHQERVPYLTYIGREPMADRLRDDPRFQKLLARVGAP